MPNFEDFIGLLFIAWGAIYIFNYVLAGFIAWFFNLENKHSIKISFPK